jgi:hypothetical protein
MRCATERVNGHVLLLKGRTWHASFVADFVQIGSDIGPIDVGGRFDIGTIGVGGRFMEFHLGLF